jgi:transposase-like protein
MSGASFRVDETYIKVGKQCKYLYRAVDKEGQTIEFMLSAKRDVPAAKRFFKKMMGAEHRRLPFSISVDKNAAYPEAFSTSQVERIVPKDCKLRRVKYLNNVIEQEVRGAAHPEVRAHPPVYLRRVALYPAGNRDVIHTESSLPHHLFQVAVRELIPAIPPDT